MMKTQSMKMILASVFLAIAPIVVSAANTTPPNTLTDAEKAAGWKLLFDGETTNGWRGYKMDRMPPGWAAVDGALVRLKGGVGGKGAGGGDDIVTTEEFESFDLSLEWKVVANGNSGVLYHVSEEPVTSWHYAPEVQILDNSAHPTRSKLELAGACYDLYQPGRDATNPPGQWNRMRIFVNGAHVEHWMNGEKIVAYELWSDDWKERVAKSKHQAHPKFGTFKKGPICLQDHSDRIEFRNIKIRALPAGSSLKPGASFDLDGRTAVLKKVETLPYIESEYTRRYRFDSFDNPKLKELRERSGLAEVIGAGRDEFEQQVLLMDWTHTQFRKFGQPSTKSRGALRILEAIEGGHTFFCQQYTEVLVSAAASLGWVDRPLALRRHQGVAQVGGSTEHSVTEIWSNQHRKWVMLDPTSNLYLERDGVPLNAYEIRQEWFYRNGTNLVFVVGKERTRHTKSDLPIFLKRFAGFGDLSVHPDELDKYGFIGYIPNTDLMDAGYEYGKMFIVKDQLCEGTQWHQRTLPAHPRRIPTSRLDRRPWTCEPRTGGSMWRSRL